MDGFLVKNEDKIHVKDRPDLVLGNAQALVPEEEGDELVVLQQIQNPYLAAMQSVEEQMQSLEESQVTGVRKAVRWAARDFQHDPDAKFENIRSNYGFLKNELQSVIPTEQQAYQDKRNELIGRYTVLIQGCEKYIAFNGGKVYFEGKERLGLIKGLLASLKVEKMYFEEQADKIYAKITADQAHQQTDVIWGNALGNTETREYIRFYANATTGLEKTFGKKEMKHEGMKTVELLSFFDAASRVAEADPSGEVLKKALTDFIVAHKSSELDKEFYDFRSYVRDRLDKSFGIMKNNKVPAFFVAAGEDANSDEVKTQYAKLMIHNDKFYQYWTAIGALAPTLGLAGVQNPVDWESDGNIATYDKLNSEMVRKALDDRDLIDRVDAKETLGKYIEDMPLLSDALGDEESIIQHDTSTFQVKRPTTRSAGEGVDLANAVSADAFKAKLTDAEGRIEGRVNAAEFTTLHDGYADDAYWNVSLKNAAEPAVDICGDMKANSLLKALKGIATPAQIEEIFKKLFDGRKRLAEKQGKNEPITPEDRTAVDKEIDEGMELVTRIFFMHVRKMEDTYGALIGQLHPEDVFRQYGDELFEHMSCMNAMKGVLGWVKAKADNDPAYGQKAATQAFLTHGNFFYDVFHRMELYFTDQGDAEGFLARFELDESVKNLSKPDAFNGISGPRMTRSREKMYNKKVQERFTADGAREELAGKLFGKYKLPEEPQPVEDEDDGVEEEQDHEVHHVVEGDDDDDDDDDE
ncbi:MAG: hypothetical protein K5985_11140 [Lachnospiraceae bacterium]|nr:hypothetical protein [Lachnospiraceae bacterium]